MLPPDIFDEGRQYFLGSYVQGSDRFSALGIPEREGCEYRITNTEQSISGSIWSREENLPKI